MGHNVILSWYRIEKKSDSAKKWGRWSDILGKMSPEIAVLTNGLDIL